MKIILIGLMALGSLSGFAQINPQHNVGCRNTNVLNLSDDKTGTFENSQGARLVVEREGVTELPKIINGVRADASDCLLQKVKGKRVKMKFKSNDRKFSNKRNAHFFLRYKDKDTVEIDACAYYSGAFWDTFYDSVSISGGDDCFIERITSGTTFKRVH